MKSTTRIKAPAILNRAAFDLTVDTIASATTRLRKLEAIRDAKIQKIQQEHATEITEIQDQIKLAASMAEKYAEAHRDELLPGKLKSAETPLARFGFRLGNRTVALLKKGCSWDAAVIILKSLKFVECVRTVEEVNKETILARTDEHGQFACTADPKETSRMPLSTIGLKINQAETFFIDPKVDGAETVKAGGAS